MKTILGTLAFGAIAAALAACHHDEAPARAPVQQETTTTTSYPSYTAPAPEPQTQMQTPPAEIPPPQESTSSTYPQEPALNPAPATPPIDSSLPDNEARPTEPAAPANAKQPAVTDQGNRKVEVQISARIRKAMMASNTLSFGAKNAKVITQGTKVTLRGTVKSDAEKNEIEGIARNTNGVTEVDDQLVVKP